MSQEELPRRKIEEIFDALPTYLTLVAILEWKKGRASTRERRVYRGGGMQTLSALCPACSLCVCV
jgi:hypothetical protein